MNTQKIIIAALFSCFAVTACIAEPTRDESAEVGEVDSAEQELRTQARITRFYSDPEFRNQVGEIYLDCDNFVYEWGDTEAPYRKRSFEACGISGSPPPPPSCWYCDSPTNCWLITCP